MRKLIALLLVAGGCSGSAHGPTTPPAPTPTPAATLQSIVLAPSMAMLAASTGAPPSQQFTATGVYSDGHSADVTAMLGWSLSDPGIGNINVGAFTGVDSRGGAVTVTASSGSVVATASLVIKWSGSRVSGDDGSTAPPTAPTLFGGTDDPSLAPALSYPLDGATVPRNLGLLEVQWKPAAGDLFEVSFESATTDFKVYTNALQPNGARLSLQPQESISIAESNQGANVDVQVRAVVTATPAKVGSSAAIKLAVGQADVNGGIYYFVPVGPSNTQVGQIVRHSFGDATAQPAFYAPTNANGSGRCVGCHVLSRDGSRIAVTYDGGNGDAAELDVASLGNLIPEKQGLHWDFGSFAPDSQRIVTASQGTLSILDSSGGAANGTVLHTLTNGSSGNYGSHPDWSPDGSQIVYVSVGAPQGNTDWQFGQGSIVVASDLGMGMFGAPQTIVKSAGENNYYPSFSPDGKWILFNRGSGQAYNDSTAELYVVAADGKSAPILLARANGLGKLTNSWPRWSPFVVHEGGQDRLYFTFSSTRDYGIELVGLGQPQVWMSAFDPAAAAAGMDPSSVPFWLPFQDVKSHNHIAQWTTIIVG